VPSFSNPNDLFLLVMSFVLIVPAIVFHEVSHGYAALALGDDTAKRARRLSLNPLKHIDPFGTVLLPILLLATSGGQFAFGYAKPVPVNPGYFRPEVDRRWGMFLVALAGPGTNLALALAGTVVFWVLAIAGAASQGANIVMQDLIYITVTFMELNLALMFFNLVPIPPLDGSRVLPLILPASARPFIYQMERYGFPILFLILFVAPLFFHVSPISWYLGVTVYPLMRLLTGGLIG
jgi:Zn-dependent protease